MTPSYIYAKKVFFSNIIPECSVPFAPYWHVTEQYHGEPIHEAISSSLLLLNWKPPTKCC